MISLPTYYVQRTAGTICIDGALDEWDWMMAERLHCLKFSHEPEDFAPLREETMVASLWDDEHLYLGFVIADREIWSDISEPGARLFPQECVELFIDPDGTGERYIEAQINSIANIRDLLIDGTVEQPSMAQFDQMATWDFQRMKRAIRIYRDQSGRELGWTLELAIPWSDLSFSRRRWPPHPGEELRVNFCRYERSQSGNLPLELSSWSPVRDFHDPARFGRFIFVPSIRGIPTLS